MSYRFDRKRIQQQYNANIVSAQGQTVTWRQYVSASASASHAGLGARQFYHEHQITAIVGRYGLPDMRQRQVAGGQVVNADYQIVTQERLSRRDEVVYQGTVYRVDTEPTPVPFSDKWISRLARGSGT